MPKEASSLMKTVCTYNVIDGGEIGGSIVTYMILWMRRALLDCVGSVYECASIMM